MAQDTFHMVFGVKNLLGYFKANISFCLSAPHNLPVNPLLRLQFMNLTGADNKRQHNWLAINRSSKTTRKSYK